MADKKRNFDDDALRRHLEQQREEEHGETSSPSLVSLVEGDNNAVFKPITFLGIIGTIIVAIVTTVTQVINFNNSYQEMEENIINNTETIVGIRDQLDIIRNELRQQIVNNNQNSTVAVDNLAERLYNLENHVDNKITNGINKTNRNVRGITQDVIEIKDRLIDLTKRIRQEEITTKELESELRVLEIRYEQSQND